MTLGVLRIVHDKYIEEMYSTCDPAAAAVIITGCSSGIGFHAAHFLASKGYRVYASVRKKEEFALFDKDELNIRPILLDVTNSSMICAAREQVEQDLSSSGVYLAGVVNNAGIGYISAVAEIDRTLLQRVLDVNLFGALETTQAFLPLITSSPCGGRIVNIGSVAGLFSSPLFAAYSASKYALEAVNDALRLEMQYLHRGRVSVSIIDPGTILNTSIRQKNIKKDTAATVSETTLIPEGLVFDQRTTSPYTMWYLFQRTRMHNADADREGDLNTNTIILIL
jgi:NAD(P)-dependent dehydrogenase (short-subunit alcohol dehydrogenase family)